MFAWVVSAWVGDEVGRRAYWKETLERAYSACQLMLELEVNECGEPLLSLPAAAAQAGVPMLFSGTKLGGRFERDFRLRAGLVPKLLAVAQAMHARGWLLEIEDGFRSASMQRALGIAPGVFDSLVERLIWEEQGRAPSVDLFFRRSLCLIANIPKIATHMSGSAVDVSVHQCHPDGRPRGPIDRGAPYLELSELTPMDSPFIDDSQRRNRAAITALMAEQGFVPYPFEFWHYNQGDAMHAYLQGSREPSRYGPVDCEPDGSVKSVKDVTALLNPLSVLQAELEAALARLPPFSD